MEVVFGEFFLLVALSLIAAMYASVGHGGASGYLAVLSLTAYAANDPVWLKQNAWCLNLLVAGIAFLAYKKSGFFDMKLALPFIIASIPAAFLGGYLKVDNTIYDVLLSLTLVFAAWKLYSLNGPFSEKFKGQKPSFLISMIVGGIIGFLSGIIGVGGGIFLSPIILIFGWSDPKTTAGIAAVFIWVNSFAGLAGSTISGQIVVEFSTLIPFGISVLIGGYVGSKYGSEKLSQNSIRSLLIVVMLIAAIRQILELVGLWV